MKDLSSQVNKLSWKGTIIMFSLHITLYLIDRTVIAAQDTLSINLVITYKGLKKQNKKQKTKQTNKQQNSRYFLVTKSISWTQAGLILKCIIFRFMVLDGVTLCCVSLCLLPKSISAATVVTVCPKLWTHRDFEFVQHFSRADLVIHCFTVIHTQYILQIELHFGHV